MGRKTPSKLHPHTTTPAVKKEKKFREVLFEFVCSEGQHFSDSKVCTTNKLPKGATLQFEKEISHYD